MIALLFLIFCSVSLSSTFSLLNLNGESIITCKKDEVEVFFYKALVRQKIVINFKPTSECEIRSIRNDESGRIKLTKLLYCCSITIINGEGKKTIAELTYLDEIIILFQVSFNINQIFREFGSDFDISISEEYNIVVVKTVNDERTVEVLKFYKSRGWSILYKPMLKSIYSFSNGEDNHSYSYFFLKKKLDEN